jgi:SAM-dependent methyltransferase
MDAARQQAKEIWKRVFEAGEPHRFCDAIYRDARFDPSMVPWAHLRPNPNVTQWLDRENGRAAGSRALVVGCGLGDDAEEFSRRGMRVIAFDLSPTAIEWCRRRFPGSTVSYTVGDLLSPAEAWLSGFDFVLDAFTLQVLPPKCVSAALESLARTVAPAGSLLLVCRGRDRSDPPAEAPPYPLARDEIEGLMRHGLIEVSFEDYPDRCDDPPVRRFRGHFRRPA